MRAIVLVVMDVLVHQPFQMPFIQHDHMVEQIVTAVANPTLGNTVLPWTSETGPLWLNAKALHGVDDFLIEARAAIKDQVARGRVIGKSFAKLLDNPGTLDDCSERPPIALPDPNSVALSASSATQSVQKCRSQAYSVRHESV